MNVQNHLEEKEKKLVKKILRQKFETNYFEKTENKMSKKNFLYKFPNNFKNKKILVKNYCNDNLKEKKRIETIMFGRIFEKMNQENKSENRHLSLQHLKGI